MKNADLVSDSWSCKHTATHVSYDYFGNKYTEKCSTKPSKHWIATGGAGIAFEVNLFGDRTQMIYTSTYNETKIEHYNNEKITITFDCKVEDKSVAACKFTSAYNHLHKNRTVTPSVDLGVDGISVSISGDSSNEYIPISNNAYVRFVHL